MLDTDLESEIGLYNVPFVTNTRTSNCPHELLIWGQIALCLQKYLGDYIYEAILQTARKGN